MKPAQRAILADIISGSGTALMTTSKLSKSWEFRTV